MARNQFARTVKVKRPGKNPFDLTYTNTLSCDPDYLIPICTVPVFPGDIARMSTEIFCRFQPLSAPVMHEMNVYVRYFYVTLRQIWPKFDEYLKAGITGDAVWPEKPHFKLVSNYSSLVSGKFDNGSLWDYLNHPSISDNDFTNYFSEGKPLRSKKVSSLKHRAYQHIWNEWFRNEVTENDIEINWDNPDENSAQNYYKLLELRKVQWEKDMFTSALPSPQLGEDVSMVMDFDADIDYVNGGQTYLRDSNGNLMFDVDFGSDVQGNAVNTTNDIRSNVDNSTNLGIRGGKVRTPTVNEWRKMFAVQRIRELAARTGTRFREIILGHFGERVPDLRVDVPMYLGGYRSHVVISEVLQTSQTTDSSPQGTQSGKAMAYAGQFNFKKKFDEHGFIMGLAYFRPRTAYFQGFERDSITFDPTEEFWPTFQHLGEQAITNQEVYFDPKLTDNEDVFGYTPRYAQYRAAQDQIHGDIRGSLSDWTFARKFNSRPGLNKFFTTAQTSLDPFAVQDTGDHHIIAQFKMHLKMIRPLSKYGTPSFI